MTTQSNYAERMIGELVAEDYRRAGIFRQYGIDFCCGGKRSVGEACQKKNLDSNTVISALEKLDDQPDTSDENFNEWEPDALAEYIVKTHHGYVRDKISEISVYSHKVGRVHGENHPELIEISQIFDMLSTELNSHLDKEENILFPYINYLVQSNKNGTGPEKPFFGSVENPIHMMEKEHDDAGHGMARIGDLSNGYFPPEDACPTFRILYQNLKAFEEDLHKHIHLENNILFPKAIELEKASEASL